MKTEALLQLARLRQSTRFDGYASIGDFHNGIFECEHVSPWTKSGCNVDAEIMIVGQDWSSSDALDRDPPDLHSAALPSPSWRGCESSSLKKSRRLP
jgi:hypothetical protein